MDHRGIKRTGVKKKKVYKEGRDIPRWRKGEGSDSFGGDYVGAIMQ